MKLVQLIYYSLVSGDLAKDKIETVLTVANKRNAEAGISGLLLFSNAYFLQVLEGPRSEVNNVYSKIQRDSRHHGAQILMYRDIHLRDFGAWAMGWANEMKVKKQERQLL